MGDEKIRALERAARNGPGELAAYEAELVRWGRVRLPDWNWRVS